MKSVVLNLLMHFLWYGLTEKIVWAEREGTKRPFVSKIAPNLRQAAAPNINCN